MKNIIFGSLFFFCAMTFPSPSHAQVPFGGLDVFMIPCTCGGAYAWHFFSPLFLGPAPVTGALAVSTVIPLAFPSYYLHPGAWALGQYTPGVQACWMYIGYGCAMLSELGVISPFTGTSL